MEYSQNKKSKNISNIDFELDLTSDNQVYYIEKQNEKEKRKTENQIEKIEMDFIIKLIDFGFFLSGFVFVYAILKINSKNKKIKYKKKNLQSLYNKKIYKKKVNINKFDLSSVL